MSIHLFTNVNVEFVNRIRHAFLTSSSENSLSISSSKSFLNVFIVPIRFADDIFDNCNNIGLLTTFYLEHLTLCELIVVKDRVMSSYQHKYGKIIIINICRGQREK